MTPAEWARVEQALEEARTLAAKLRAAEIEPMSTAAEPVWIAFLRDNVETAEAALIRVREGVAGAARRRSK